MTSDMMAAMNNVLVSALVLSLGSLGGCAMPDSGPAATASTAVSSSVNNTTAAESAGSSRTVWVPPPVGSLLGGGYVRVANSVQGNDENALIGTIKLLNAAAGTQVERPYVIAAVSRTTGVSERELQAQQDVLQLRFGELCAINTIARGNSNKVQEIASQKRKGRSWTELAQSNGVGIATVVQTARNANELTINSYSNSAERAKGGQQKLKEMGVKVQPNVQPGG